MINSKYTSNQADIIQNLMQTMEDIKRLPTLYFTSQIYVCETQLCKRPYDRSGKILWINEHLCIKVNKINYLYQFQD